MKTSEKGIALIKSFEGCRLTAYLCPAGVWTIGYGHTAGVSNGQAITQEQADSFLKADLEKYEKYVNATGLTLNQNQFDALVSFTYNCGAGNLKKLIANRTLPEIADAMLLYNKGGGKVLAGLVRRREAERTRERDRWVFLEFSLCFCVWLVVLHYEWRQEQSLLACPLASLTGILS